MAPITAAAPIATVVNTHANGDHCYGNQLVAGEGVEVVATEASAQEMEEVPASLLAALTAADLRRRSATACSAPSGRSTSRASRPRRPTARSPAGRPSTPAAGRSSSSRSARRTPAATCSPGCPTPGRVHGRHPLHRRDADHVGGPIGNWIAACELIESLDPAAVVPGHGPLASPERVRAVGDYLRFVRDGATARHAAGMDAGGGRPRPRRRDRQDAVRRLARPRADHGQRRHVLAGARTRPRRTNVLELFHTWPTTRPPTAPDRRLAAALQAEELEGGVDEGNAFGVAKWSVLRRMTSLALGSASTSGSAGPAKSRSPSTTRTGHVTAANASAVRGGCGASITAISAWVSDCGSAARVAK